MSAMDMEKWISRKVWISFILVLIIQILFDPLSGIKNLSENVQARVGLPSARERWDSQNITHYKFDVDVGNGACIWQASIEVENGVVVDIGSISDFDDFSLGPPPIIPSSPGWFFVCDYRNFTMPKLFDELERSLLEHPLSITSISFDPKYGFISGSRSGSPGGWGLLRKRTIFVHCCSGFNIRNFQIIDN